MTNKSTMSPMPKYATVNQIAELYPFSLASIRYMIYKAQNHTAQNIGLARCLRYVGSKILFNIAEFDAWIEGQTEEHRKELKKKHLDDLNAARTACKVQN